MVVLGLRFCARTLSSRGKRGSLFIAVRRPPTIVAPPVAEHRLQMRRFSNCGSRAQPLRGMWDPPRPGLEPVSPALAGRLSTTAPPGKPLNFLFIITIAIIYWVLFFCEALCSVTLYIYFILIQTHKEGILNSHFAEEKIEANEIK